MKTNKGILMIIICVVIASLFTACSGSDDYSETLNSGLKKYYSGESMNKKEYNAVKNFNNWKKSQGEKHIMLGI